MRAGDTPTRYFPNLADLDAPGRRFRCSVCDCIHDEDDCEQAQPDGHYVCPFEQCGDDTLVALSRVEHLQSLLREVTLDEMGGTPDLFEPRRGWDDWNERAMEALRWAPT